MHIVHVVCSSAFAGVERYVLTSGEMAAASERVTVIGGDPRVFPSRLDAAGATWMPGSDRREALRSLRSIPDADVIVTHMTDADVVGAIGARRRVPIVSTRHFAAPRGSGVVARAVGRLVSRRVRAEISISDFVAAHVGVASTVIHSGVPLVEAAPIAREQAVLVLQRLEPEKRTDIAIRTWAASQGPASGWRLWVGGEGAERAALEALADDLGVSPSVDFLGFVDDTAALYRRASVFLAPTPHEGLGLAVLEAMAQGVPVVASAAGGHLETVGADPGARLFPAADVALAAAALDGLLLDEPARVAYGERLRAIQQAEFTVQRQISRTLDVFRSVQS